MFMDKMRHGAQTKAAKVVFVVIMLSFALAGVGGYAMRKPNTDPAEVNGVTVESMKFDQAYRQQKQQLQRQMGERYQEILAADPDFLNGLRMRVLNSMIDGIILDQRSSKAGFRVSDDAIKNIIVSDYDEFKVDGKFNNERYLNVITRAGYATPDQFAHDLKLQVVDALYQGPFVDAQFALPYEISLMNRLERQERTVDVYSVQPFSLAASVAADKDAVQKYYSEHASDFVQGEQVAVEYVLLSRDAVGESLKPSEEDIKKYYDENQDKFLSKAKYHAAHIYVGIGKNDNAEEKQAKIAKISEKLKAGEAFEAVAAELSEDVLTAQKGGDLGWQPYGTLEKGFEEAVKTMSENGISDAITTEYGVHFVKLIERKDAAPMPLDDDIRAQITKKIGKDKIDEVYSAKLDQLTVLANEMPDDLSGIAKELGLQVQTSNYFDEGTTVAPFNSKQLQKTVFSKDFRDEGMNSEVINIDQDNAIVVHVTGYKEPYTKPFEEVSAKAESDYRLAAAKDVAKTKAEELKTMLVKGENADQFIADNQIGATKDSTLKRSSPSYDPGVMDAIYAMPKKSDGVNARVADGMDGNTYVIVLKNVKEAEGDGSDNEKFISSSLVQMNAVRDAELLKSQMREESDVEINTFALKQYAALDGNE